MSCRPYILLGCLVSLLMQRALAQERTLACQREACIPDSGDILIGRGDRISINSTCGMVKAENYVATCTDGPPRPCLFVCNANDSSTSHPPENIAQPYSSADVNKTWWQSSIGDEVVLIEINLKALFHFTHFVMTFRSPRPLSLIVEKSRDFGKTYSVYQYFADDCLRRFGMESRDRVIDINDVICTESYLKERSNEIVYRVLPPYLRITSTELYSHQVTEKITITNLRFTMAIHDLSLIPLNAEAALYQYFAVYSLVLRGWCFCYGHASECDPIEGVPQQPGMVNPICRCIHNTRGSNCEECEPLYNNRPWKAATPNGEANECEKCQCYDHAVSCHYDEEEGGGVCDNCTHNTTGTQCEKCLEFFYRNTTTLRNDRNVCLKCACDPAGSEMEGKCIGDDDNSRSLRSGQCLCKTNVEASDPYTTLCDTCLLGYFNLSADNPDGCEACNCNSAGSLGEECDQKSGRCRCKSGVTGVKCDQCKVERCCLSSSDPEGCRPCNCDVGGSYDLMCDVDTGQCQCRENIEGLKCDILPNGTFVNIKITIEIEEVVTDNKTKIINVGNKTYVVEVTSNTTIDVTVDPEITTGNKITITFGIPNNTNVTDVNFNITINATNPVDRDKFPGGPCRDGTISTTSSTTSFTVSGRDAVFNPRTGLYTVEVGYVCLEENTNYTISINLTDKNTTVYLDKIDIIPDVRVLNFTPPTIDVNCSVPLPPLVCEVYTVNVTVNNTITVPCDDSFAIKELITDPSCELITKVVIILNNGSNLCNCDAHGSLNDSCETIGGQCNCRPGLGGRRCDRCLPHLKRTSLEMCTECSCDVQGSLHKSCNVNTGQCVCLPGVTALTCDRCLDGHYDFGNPEGCTPCNCDDVGSSSVDCDGNGTCSCHPGVVGDKCDRCAPDHYGFSPSGCQPCDCDADGSLFTGSCGSISGQCTCRVGVSGRRCDQCESSPLGPSRTIDGYCIDCFCNGFSNDCGRADGWYQAQVSYAFTGESESQNWTSNSQVTWKGGYLEFSTDFSTNDTTLEVLFPPDAIGNKRTAYGHFLVMTLQLNQSKGTPLENTPLFVIETSLNQYSDLRLEAALNPFSDGLQSVVIPLVASSFQRVTFLSFPASENDLRKVLADIKSMKLIVQFSADSVARQPTLDLHSFHFNYAVDDPTHSHALVPPTAVQFVEQCECPVSRHGEVCQFCSEGYTRDPPSGGQFAKCVKCFCFGHADSCHPETGVCINCSDNTAGDHCENCRTGYYRNFTSNTCEECKCFGGPDELNQFTQECSVNSRDQVVCECPEGFLQPDCGRCAPGFYGDPTKPDGNCRLCECNNNSVTTGPQCDSVRGVCNCINPYTGDSCERCKDGYHGDAVMQMCSVCDCDDVGTESGTDCGHLTGQCVCRENTTGLRCDRCQPGTYGLRTLGACVGCRCCVPGSASANCTQDLGICNCLPGYTGSKCCGCDDGYHDNGEGRCIECNCPVDIGASLSNVCDKSSGQCPCKEGVMGLKCESCLPNTSGLLPLCEPCDECYDRWFDRIRVFLSDVHVAISIAESLNITITPVEDLFQLIRDINDTINLSRIEPEVYNTTNENIRNLTLFVRDLLDRGGEYRQRLEEASELDTELWNSTLNLNVTLQSLVSQAAQLNQSYPILDCEPFRLLVESGYRRSNMADRLVANDVANLTANVTVHLQDYRMKRAERNFEDIEGRLGDMIIRVQELLRDYNYLLDNVTVSLCGGGLTECGPCGGSSCGFCSVAVECGGLLANASLALESATSARILGQFLQQNLSSSIRTLQELGREISTLLEEVTMTGSFVTELRERVNATHTLVLAVLAVLNETSNYLKEATPEMIAALEEETLSYRLTRTPEQVLDLLSELRATLSAFPPWVDANNTALSITAEALWRNARHANDLALNATVRAETVRKELIKHRRDAQNINDDFRLTDQNMKDSRMQSAESSSLLTNIEGNLTETEALLDHLEGFLVDVQKRFAENEDRLTVVQATTDRIEELADKTKTSTDVLDKRVESLSTSASDSATTTTMNRNETTHLRIRMEEVNKKSLRQLTEVEDMLRRQNHLRQRQKQVKDDIVHIKIELEDLSKDISRNTFKNTGCQRIGGAG